MQYGTGTSWGGTIKPGTASWGGTLKSGTTSWGDTAETGTASWGGTTKTASWGDHSTRSSDKNLTKYDTTQRERAYSDKEISLNVADLPL